MERISKPSYTFDTIIGESKVMRDILDIGRKIASTDTTVLLHGESGTGKELLASAIHNASKRAHGPFIQINCAAIPENLLESEFFGYERGAFSNAHRRKLGMFEIADTGTIFLDEIGDMDLKLQGKLLHVLQNGEFQRIGGTSRVRVNVRVISATNRNLEELIEKRLFRLDLYYRLNVVNIKLPPLRERKEDIQLLTHYLLERKAKKIGKPFPKVTEEVLRMFEEYSWPGNVRELENVLERAIVLLTDGKKITEKDICLIPPIRSIESTTLCTFAQMEKQLLQKALEKYGRTVKGKQEAAAALGISLSTLYEKLKGINEGTEELMA